MEFYSLLDSYGHVVYENKKVWKKVFGKYFFERSKNIYFSKSLIFSKIRGKSTFHRPISEPYTSLLHLKHSAIDRSRPQLYPGMFFVANGCLTVKNELSKVEGISQKTVIFKIDKKKNSFP